MKGRDFIPQYGYRIKNIEAGSIFEYNCGVREYLDTTPAMLSNSLFTKYLEKIGLKANKRDYTRDVICILFDYGTRSAKEERKHLDKQYEVFKKKRNDYTKERSTKIEEFYKKQYKKLESNPDKFIKKSKQQLRESFYVDGVDVTYDDYGKDGKIKHSETIHYRMLYRTPGKAKKGSCMFIREELYEKAHDFLWMGYTLPEHNAPIVEIGAYSSLITSSIIDEIKINPENILILKDYDSEFITDVISIETDENKQCHALKRSNYTLKNTMFDGQSLIDSSIFPALGNGYVLLRQHMFKSAAFKTHIQKFFKDYYVDRYDTATIKDMFGNEHLVKDIKLITTDNSCKFLKFGFTYEYWCDKIHEQDDYFGIVKTAHKSKLGNVQQMSYQMVSALEIGCMNGVLSYTSDYVDRLKNDDGEFLKYLHDNQNFANDYEVLIALVEHNSDFIHCDYYKERKRHIIDNYLYNLKFGKLLQDADNLVIVGSPYAMLMYSVGLDPETDPTFKAEDETMQCYTARFRDGEYLAEFRSPFNSRNNLGYVHNHYHEYFDKYFDFGKQIIAVNMVHTPWQPRNNGSDQDSDMVYVTNQKDIVACAKKFYKNYLTIENNIPKEKNIYDGNIKNFVKIDNNLASSQMGIGESSNIAALAECYAQNSTNPVFDDCSCILAVIAQCCIDNSKRHYNLNINDEIRRIKRIIIDNFLKDGNMVVYNDDGTPDKKCIYPLFWYQIKKKNDARNGSKNFDSKKLSDKINLRLKAPMNLVAQFKAERKDHNTKTISISDFFVYHKLGETNYRCKKVEALIENYSLDLYRHETTSYNDVTEVKSAELLLRKDFNDLVNDIRKISLSSKYVGLISWLIDRSFTLSPGMKRNYEKYETKLDKNRSILFKVLYTVNRDAFLQCFKKKMNDQFH